MQRMDETSLIRAWQKCFMPQQRWRRIEIPGLTQKLWCAHDNGVGAYLASSCASTMDLARTLAEDGRFPEMSWAAAAVQTRGRGQAGRRWDGALGNLYATIRLPDRAAGTDALLPLALGRIIAEELKHHMPAPQIKWPNDILMGEKKAGGILVEERQGVIMAGIGLNVETVPEAQTDHGRYTVPACSLREFGCTTGAPALWRSMANAIKHNLMPILATPEELLFEAEQMLAFRGDSVILEDGNGETRLVRISGLDRAGHLVVETPRGKETVTCGRIIPRIMI